MKYLKILFIGLLCLQSFMLGAQNRISGTITDNDSFPVPGAGIIVEGTSTGTVSDLDGKWELDADPGQKLIISCMGYTSQSILVSDRSVYDCVLVPDNQFLEEVVVVGYDTQKR